MQPLSQVSEREERESYTREYEPNSGMEYIYSPFPLLAVM
jgi:hypothetical protein